MSIGTLWFTPGAKYKIIAAAAAYGGLKFDAPADYVHRTDNKKPEFLSKFPHGKVAAFEGKDGFRLFEGTAIARYIAGLAPNSGLLSGSSKDAALVDQWIHLVDEEVSESIYFIYMILSGGLTPYSKTTHTFFSERLLRALKTLNGHLATRTFFVGERITLADIVVAAQTQRGAQMSFGPETRAELPHLFRHMETIVNQPKLKDIFGTTAYLDKAPQYTPLAKEKKEPKAPAAPAAPKVPKAKAKAADDDDEEDSAVPAEPKVKNPLDDLPKSTFNLEDWKRAYSNLDTRGPGGALEWFYKNFDKEGFSIWRVDFKYNEELTQTFMSSNQISGFFNRLEASRKYAFGSVGVLGVANDSRIAGVFILRGQEAAAVVDVAPDWESYSYAKLDLEKNEDKSYFEAALAWDLELDGKKWVDGTGKAFK